MENRRYPRPGQRLAPAILAELLESPLPRSLRRFGKGARLRLCDLDESAWRRFTPEQCAKLAHEIVLAVGKAARTARPLADRKLPPLPDAVRLTDLPLETRTVNALRAAGLLERPQDLAQMTIEQALHLPGFWARCLVDLLVSIEHAVAHPKTIGPTGGDRMAGRASSRYPQPGHRLAPQILRELLLAFIPGHLVQGTRFEGARLCDLDESAWDQLQPEAIAALAQIVADQVSAGLGTRGILRRAAPAMPKGLRLEDLRLDTRTWNCLARAGLSRRPGELGRWTIGQLLAIEGLGVKCLLDLLCAVETCAARAGTCSARLTAEVKALQQIPRAGGIQFSDPRLGPTLRGMDRESSTLKEMVERLARRRRDPGEPDALAAQLARLRRWLDELSWLPLESELLGIFAAGAGDRDRQIVAAHFGWDGRQGETLQRLAQRHGLSRERARQVCTAAVRRTRGRSVFAPVLDRTLDFIAERLPATIDQIQRDLAGAGLSVSGVSALAVAEAAELLGRRPTFAVIELAGRLLAVPPHQSEWLTLAVRAAGRAIQSSGAARLDELLAAMKARQPDRPGDRALLLKTLPLLPELRWVDDARRWFHLGATAKGPLAETVRRVLAVVDQMEIARLHAALSRNHRRRSLLPPPVLLEYCRGIPGVILRGTRVIAQPRLDWREELSGVERTLVEILSEHGPALDRSRFEELGAARGVNPFSFNAVVGSSPLIVQPARRVYALLGTKPTRRQVAAAASHRAGDRRRVLTRFWQGPRGKFCLAYRLSRASISGGVLTMPAAVKRKLHGSYRVTAPGSRDSGTLVSTDGCAWGLGPALRRHDAKPGDHLLLVLDVRKRVARLRLGNESMIHRLAGHTAVGARKRRKTG